MRARGQVMVLALAAMALVVLASLYLVSRGRGTERAAQAELDRTTEARDALVDVRSRAEAVLDRAVAEAVLELGAHGGYPAGGAPLPAVNGVPYYFYRGAVANLPTDGAVEAMLAARVESLAGDSLASLDLGEGVSFGAPSVRARLSAGELEARMELAYSVRSEGREAREVASVSRSYPLRLGLLLRTARAFVGGYARDRTMEGMLLTALLNDPRVPAPPGMVSGTVPCGSRTVLRERGQLLAPVREGSRLAAARAMALALLPDGALEWEHSVDERAVNLTLLANAGVPGFESTKDILLVPSPAPLADAAQGQCLGRYTVSYSVDFPVRLVLRDLDRASRAVGAKGKDLVRPVELAFYLRPLLAGEDATAREELGLPAEVSDPCSGACGLELAIEGSREGTVALGRCSYPYAQGRLSREEVPCGVATVTVSSSDPTGLARAELERNVRGTLRETVRLEAFGRIGGRVLLNRTVLCTEGRRVEERGLEPVGFVPGSPDRYVEVLLAPLGEGPVLRAVADAEGRYAVPRAEPGRYLRVARPSRDEGGAPTLMAQVAADVVAVGPGESAGQDIVLQPLLTELVGGVYVPVADREAC